MKLSHDIARCVGRFGLDEESTICPRRESCARYVTMRADHLRWPHGYPLSVSVHTGLCRHGDDFMIPLNDQPVEETR